MRIQQDPLSAEEVIQLEALLDDGGARSLAFARGVFAAASSAPTELAPTEWLPLILGDQVPNKGALRQILALLIRDCNSCADCLALGVPAVPQEEEKITEFCKGFVQVAQRDAQWKSDADAFAKTLPFMALSGYADLESVTTLSDEAKNDPAAYLERERAALSERVAENYKHFAEAREKPKAPSVREEKKVGRNDPCPCDSGKKYKKCCGTH